MRVYVYSLNTVVLLYKRLYFLEIYFTKAMKDSLPKPARVNDRALREYSKVLHFRFK